MRKKFAPAAVAAALLALAIALVGCSSGPSDEEVIRQGVSEELAAIKAGDDELISSVEEGAGEDLKTLGIDARDFMSAYLDGFDYSVGDVKVDGDSATVHLSITCRSMGEATEAFMGAYGDALADAEDLTEHRRPLRARWQDAAGKPLGNPAQDRRVRRPVPEGLGRQLVLRRRGLRADERALPQPVTDYHRSCP